MKRIDGIVYANQAEAFIQLNKHIDRLDDTLRRNGISGVEATMFKMLVELELVNFVIELFEVKENADE